MENRLCFMLLQNPFVFHIHFKQYSFNNNRIKINMNKYGEPAEKKVEKAMHEYKRGELKIGRGGKGGRAKSRKQAIAIGLSQARRAGGKVPKKNR